MKNSVNRCRPGFGSSCSLCCGSHNYTFSSDRIEEIFNARDNEPNRQFKHPEESCEEKLVKDGLQCANIGMSQKEPGTLCCMTYDDDHAGSGFESFFTGTCKNFRCTAWNELTDRQVLFAAELMNDWYYYSLLINSIEMTMELCAEYEAPGDVPAELLEEIKGELVTKLMENELF